MGANATPSQATFTQAVQPAPKRVVTSRCAESLFWLGRYSERAECGLHTAQHILSRPNETLQDWLSVLAVQNALVLPSVPSLAQSPRVFERSLLAALGDAQSSYSLGFNLLALKNAAFTVRERLSQEQWNLIAQTQQHFTQQSQALVNGNTNSNPNNPMQPVLSLLTHTNIALAAITGAQTDRMARDDGWRLLSIGRLIERLQFLAAALCAGFEQGALSFDAALQSQPRHKAGYQAMIALFDSSTTFRAQHPGREDMAALLESLVLDRDNPRSLAWVAKTLRGRLAKLAGDMPQDDNPLSRLVPDARHWQLADLIGCNAQGEPMALQALLAACTTAATQVAQAIGAQYFTHAQSLEISVGA